MFDLSCVEVGVVEAHFLCEVALLDHHSIHMSIEDAHVQLKVRVIYDLTRKDNFFQGGVHVVNACFREETHVYIVLIFPAF